MALPAFDLQGGVTIALARGLTVTALLSAFGTMVFRSIVAPKVFACMAAGEVAAAARQLHKLAQASAALALCGAGLWLVTQAGAMADAGSIRDAFAAVPIVLWKTSFGHVIAFQLAALAPLAILLTSRPDQPPPKVEDFPGSFFQKRTLLLALTTTALCLQSGHSHAFSMDTGPSLLLACDILHLLGAGAWLGGLLPLLLMVRLAQPKAGAVAARWFSPMGQMCIAALVVSAAWQGWVLVATIPGLIGTAYGWMILVKSGLFGVLLAFAYVNRYRFAPALLGARPEAAKRVLMRSLVAQTGAALAILAAAIVLSELPPSMHLQPLWPFSQRVSLVAIGEDADFRRDVIEAAGALAAASLLLVTALILRRLRLAALAMVIAALWFARTQADLLLVTAYPTSFYHSPSGFTVASIVDGGTAYAAHCVACHGSQGHGDGSFAKTLPVPPADLTAAHLWMHQDGELFWWIGHGMAAPDGTQAMPGFAAALDEDTRWDVIDYIRAHNAGLTVDAAGVWGRAIPAPAFSAHCADGRTRTLADFAGAPLLLALGAPPPAPPGLRIVAASFAISPRPGVCVAPDRLIGAAYAIAAGLHDDAAGAVFLIDAQGLLRRVWAPGRPPDAAALTAALAQLGHEKITTALQQGGAMGGMKMPGMKM
jgi:putative copper export protein/mono/diheme cytochrome c family protein